MSAILSELPIWAQVIFFIGSGIGTAIAVVFGYRKVPKEPEADRPLALAGALIDSRDAELIIFAVQENTRGMDRLERALDRLGTTVDRASEREARR